jgi:hypothetical protein
MIERKYIELTDTLNEMSPMSAIEIIIRLSDKSKTLIDESKTLVLTLLPYLKDCLNFDFIKKENHKICIIFIQTLV